MKCDFRLREDLLRPACIGCSRLYLTLEAEKKPKKPKGTPAAMSILLTEQAQANKYPTMMLVNNGELSEPPPPPPPKSKKGSAAALAAGSTSTGTNAKKKTRKRRGEEARAVVIRASESAKEDAVLRARRGKGVQGDRSAHEEWYSYSPLDLDLAETRRTIYVCGKCNFARNWLRKLEDIITVQNFRSILRCDVKTLDSALMLLGLGVYGERLTGEDPEGATAAVAAKPKTAVTSYSSESDASGTPRPPPPQKTPATIRTMHTTEQKRAIARSKERSEEELEKSVLKIKAKLDKKSAMGTPSKGGKKKAPTTARQRIEAILRKNNIGRPLANIS